MKLRVLTIEDVSQRQLCTGCGVCASVEPDRFRIGDDLAFGRRPFVLDDAPATSGDALQVCPGASLEHTFDPDDPKLISELTDVWGPVYEIWEGYASADDIRFAGSSGGAATALSLYCIEQGGMAGVLHTGARKDVPYLNESVYSTDREELLARTGSRYAPASPCDSLHLIENADKPSVFIGKPCDIAAIQKACVLRPELDSKIGLTIAFFCAGSPSVQGTLDLLGKAGVEDPDRIQSLRYRGNGWPGMWSVKWSDREGKERSNQMSYAESWHFLQKYRQWRCYICPDHTGEFADIAVGDPWYRDVEPGEPGKSLIVVRTARGQAILLAAVDAGYLSLESKDPSLLPRSQPNILGSRRTVFGRVLAMRLAGVPVPKFVGFNLFWAWLRQDPIGAVKSIVTTFKRIHRKGLHKPVAQSEDQRI